MKKKVFDFTFINKNNVYVGDIILVKHVNKKILNELKNCGCNMGDYSNACEIITAKENAILIKVEENCYVDIDSIKRKTDCNYINECLINGVLDNIILNCGTYNPYVGQLFLRNVRSYKDIEKEKFDIMELKLYYKNKIKI